MSKRKVRKLKSARPMGLKLDLACGNGCLEGWIGVDLVKIPGHVSVVHDLTKKPWPFADNSVDEVNCSHFFEHLDGQERITFMEELCRVLKPMATATIICPHWASIRAMQDPTHKFPPICEGSMSYYDAEWRFGSGLGHYPINCDLTHDYEYVLSPGWNNRNDGYIQHAIRHYNNVINDLKFILTKPPKPRKFGKDAR